MSCIWSVAVETSEVYLQQSATAGTDEGQQKFGKSVSWFVCPIRRFRHCANTDGVRKIGARKRSGRLQDVLATGRRVNCRYTVSRTSVPPSIAQIRDTAAAAVDAICGLSISHRVDAQHPVSVALYRVIFAYVSPSKEADLSTGRSHAI